MNTTRQKTQRAFVAVTMVTVMAVATVFMVYALLLGTFYGGNVTVVSEQIEIQYSTDNATWATSLDHVANGSAWYSRFSVTGTGYHGDVNITWTLEYSNGTPVGDTQNTNNFHLTGDAAQLVYASSNGLSFPTLKNWGTSTTSADTYRIKVEIQTS